MNNHIPTHGINNHSPECAYSNPRLVTRQAVATPPHYNHSPAWGQCSTVPIATSPSYEQEKRVRDGPGTNHGSCYEQQQQDYYQPSCDDGIAPPSSGKKARQNNYQPPRHMNTKSVVAVTGSLVGGGWNAGTTTTVQMRRELSSGKLDQFFHNDAMDDSLLVEPVESRRRSMSF
jgi:hypothetical protein